jgi:hypothetical protein
MTETDKAEVLEAMRQVSAEIRDCTEMMRKVAARLKDKRGTQEKSIDKVKAAVLSAVSVLSENNQDGHVSVEMIRSTVRTRADVVCSAVRSLVSSGDLTRSHTYGYRVPKKEAK